MTTLQREALTPIRRRPFDEFGNVSYNNYGGEASSIMDYITHNGGFDVGAYKAPTDC